MTMIDHTGQGLAIRFRRVRDTRTMTRFDEDTPDGAVPVVRNIYVRTGMLRELGIHDELVVILAGPEIEDILTQAATVAERKARRR